MFSESLTAIGSVLSRKTIIKAGVQVLGEHAGDEGVGGAPREGCRGGAQVMSPAGSNPFSIENLNTSSTVVTPAREQMQPRHPTAREAFEKLDTNADGLIDRAEWARAGSELPE